MGAHGQKGASMTARKIRALTFGFLASTAIATPAFAQDPAQAPAPDAATAEATATAAAQPAPAAQTPPPAQVTDQDSNEIIITAQKRDENLQDVPISVQAIGTRRLDQLNVSNFEEYTKQLPSGRYQTAAPGFTVVYMRGVATGGDGNHTGSLPSVGSYLDEQPI